MLDPNLYINDDTRNSFEAEISPIVFINNGILYIKEAVEDEIIQVDSVTGRLLYQITPLKKSIGYFVPSSDEKIFVVKGSSGWVKKVIQHTK